ncbi:MAG: membrane protein insertase YidC [bacterium JZ-2024 1]
MIYALAIMMFQILSLLHLFIGSWALSIVLFTILVRLMLHPMTYQQQRFSKKIQKIQPEFKALEPLKKKDLNEYNKAVMGLYSKHGINPAAGCLPLLIQLPVMLALFAMLRNPVINQGLLSREKFLGMPMDAVAFQTTPDLPVPTEFVDFLRASPEEPAEYRVRARVNGTSEASEIVEGYTREASPRYQILMNGRNGVRNPDNPLYAKVSQGAFADKIAISYPPYPFTKFYKIRKYLDPETVEILTPEKFRGTTFEDKNVEPGKVYAYEVIAVLQTGEEVSSGLLPGYTGGEQPWGVRASRGTYSDAIVVRWYKPMGIEEAVVERRLKGEPNFKQIATLKPRLLPATYTLRKGKSGAPSWHLIYLPAILLVILYALGQWLYQRDFSRHFSTPESSKYFNPNIMMGMFLIFSVIFPVGLILYFITYLVSGVIENRIVLKRLAMEEKRLSLENAGSV